MSDAREDPDRSLGPNFPLWNLINSAIAALAVVAAGVSAYMTWSTGVWVQNRQILNEQISKIDSSFASVTEAFIEFNASLVNFETKKLEDSKLKIAIAASKSSDTAISSKPFLKDEEAINEYSNALAEFVKLVRSTSGPRDMKPTIEAFGRANDIRDRLRNKVAQQIGS